MKYVPFWVAVTWSLGVFAFGVIVGWTVGSAL